MALDGYPIFAVGYLVCLFVCFIVILLGKTQQIKKILLQGTLDALKQEVRKSCKDCEKRMDEGSVFQRVGTCNVKRCVKRLTCGSARSW